MFRFALLAVSCTCLAAACAARTNKLHCIDGTCPDHNRQLQQKSCVGHSCLDIAEKASEVERPVRKLQSLKRVVVMPSPPHLEQVVESLLNYLVVHEAYYAWSKEWFPKPLADAWFEFAGNKMFERFEIYVDELVQFFAPFFEKTINQCFTQKHCELDLKRYANIPADYDVGLSVVGELQTMKNLCDFRYKYFGKSDVEIGRTAFTQFTLDFDTFKNDLVTIFTLPVHFYDGTYKGNPIQILGGVKGNLHLIGAPSGFDITLNGPKLKPWGPDAQSVVNACAEKARYDYLRVSVDFCYADVEIKFNGGSFKCPFDGHKGGCPLDYDPKTCEKICTKLSQSLCHQTEKAVAEDIHYLADFLGFCSTSLMPYCQTGTRTDPVI